MNNMEEVQILQDDLSVEEMLNKYRERERELMNIQYEDLQEDLVIAKKTVDYCRTKQFFGKIANSLDFLSASVGKVNGANGYEIEGIIPSEQYCNSIAVLSDNRNTALLDTVYANDCQPTFNSEERAYREDMFLQSVNSVVSNPSVNKLYGGVTNELAIMGVTVEMLKNEVAVCEQMMLELGIEEKGIDSIREQTMDKFIELKGSGEIISFSQEVEQIDRDLVIVESNDGYVMATNLTQEMAMEHPNLAREFDEKVSLHNEVIHNTAPKETTSDLSKVGGNVQYEAYDDIGTVEKGNGVKTYEEKEAESSKTDVSRNGDTTTKTTTTTKKRDTYERDF